MYIEENEKRRFPLVDFLLKLVLIIIFVLLLMWLIPWPNNDVLKDQIFNANLQEMKEAATMYFTTERLPQEVGDKTKLTLQDMLDLKLLLPFVDKNGKSCDVEKSYVSLEKLETEYLMKVNLKCSEEEDYILVHMGCYSYCTTDICEKQEETKKPVATKKPTTNTIVVKPTTVPTVKPTYTPTPKPTPTPTPNAEKEYEYKKNFAAEYSAWTDWREYTYTASDNIKFEMTDTKQVVNLGTRQVLDYTIGATYKYVLVENIVPTQVDSVSYKVCAERNYMVYQTGGTSSTSTLYSYGDWANTNEYKSGYSVPETPTATTRWVAVGVDWDVCGSNCTNSPYIKWRKQTRSASATSTTTGSNGEMVVVANCTSYATKTIGVYINKTIPSKQLMKLTDPVNVYKTVSVYKIRVRNLTQAASTKYVWSSYNNQALLNEGYAMTGKTRNK